MQDQQPVPDGQGSVMPGTLYIVSTPIGNLADMTQRALEVLRQVDQIAAEDTRHSRRLLDAYSIATPMCSYHEHSDGGRISGLLARLNAGDSLALISDAGTPLISDPGYALVRDARAAGVRVVPIPGACALTAALAVSGLPSDRFTFEGFLPAKSGARLSALQLLAQEPRTMIFYEAPHRILDSLGSMVSVFGAQREAVLARELTKTFETVRNGMLSALQAWVAEDANQQRGEIVVLVRGAVPEPSLIDAESERILSVLLSELPLKQAAALTAKITGQKKNALYDHALKISR